LLPEAGAHAAVPHLLQLDHVGAAPSFEAKIFDAAVAQTDIPFVGVPVLENPPARKIMLAHRAVQGMDGVGNQDIRLSELSKGQMEGLLIAVQVLIVKVGVLVKPHGQAKRPPASPSIHHHLAAFELRLLGLAQSAASPDGSGFWVLPSLVIGPENRPSASELGSIEQKLRIDHRHIVGIEQQDFPERAMEEGIRLEFPSVQGAGRKLPSPPGSVDAPNVERS
jgi:hypothetical protein